MEYCGPNMYSAARYSTGISPNENLILSPTFTLFGDVPPL